MGDDELSPEEWQELLGFVKQQGLGAGYPAQEQDKSMVGFFRDIAEKIKKTFRVGNVTVDELSVVRGYLDTASYAETVGLKNVGVYLENKGLILTDTSLSKEGFLIRMAITTKREAVSKLGEIGKKKKSGWKLFGDDKKEEGGE